MIKLKKLLSEGKLLTVYRGVSVHNKDGNYFTTDPEWARNFTQSGQDKEILQVDIDPSNIYRQEPLPMATDEEQVNAAIAIARQKGFSAIWVDEGHNEPNSIFVFRKGKLRNVQRYKSQQISESKRFNMDNKDEAAEALIRMAWKLISKVEDRYDFDDVVMYIDNEQSLSKLAWQLGEKFYPGDPEGWYSFHTDVKRVLSRLEVERLERRKKATPSLKDPLYILKKLIVGTTWKQAKTRIFNQLPGRFSDDEITDEDADLVFNRLYKNAMGETVYNKTEIERWGYGRLDQAQISSDTANHRAYALNVFIRTYAGENKKFDGNVRVWRGTNSPHANIRPGDFVTFDRGYSQHYISGKWKSIVTDILPSKDFIIYKVDIGSTELVYWPDGHQIKKYEGTIPSFREFWETYRFGL